MSVESQRWTPRQVGLFMAVVCGLCWAVLAIGLKVALDFTDTSTVVWFRLVVAFGLATAWMACREKSALRILLRPPLLGLVAALGLTANYFSYTKGLELTSPSNAQIFIQLAPILLIVVGIFFFGERPSRLQLAGFIVTTIGFGLFYQDQIHASWQERQRYIEGDLWIVFASVTWVIFAALQKVLTRVWSPQQLNLLIYLLASMLLFPLVDLAALARLSPMVWLLLFVLGLNTFIAYSALGYALKALPARDVSLIITMNPLLTIALMQLLGALNVSWIAPDPLHATGLGGALFVVAGVIMAVRQAEKSGPLAKLDPDSNPRTTA